MRSGPASVTASPGSLSTRRCGADAASQEAERLRTCSRRSTFMSFLEARRAESEWVAGEREGEGVLSGREGSHVTIDDRRLRRCGDPEPVVARQRHVRPPDLDARPGAARLVADLHLLLRLPLVLVEAMDLDLTDRLLGEWHRDCARAVGGERDRDAQLVGSGRVADRTDRRAGPQCSATADVAGDA